MNSSVYKILNKIEITGNTAYLVGGAVRDYLLNRSLSDFDITTSANPGELLKIFTKGKIINRKMGTVRVAEYDITPYRLESKYYDNRWPMRTYFSKKLDDDLSRRDFTINSIVMDKEGKMIDKFRGLSDLNQCIIRTVGNPDKRFKEDALRMLRAIRFACQLNFRIEKKTYEAIKKNRYLVKKLSVERIRDEFNKIILSDNLILGMNLLKNTGILEIIVPEYKASYNFDQLNCNHKYDLFTHMIRVGACSSKELSTRLASILHDIEKPSTQVIFDDGSAHYYGHDIRSAETAKEILKRFKYPNSVIKKTYKFIENHMKIDRNIGMRGIRRLKTKFGEDVFDFISLVRSDSINSSGDLVDKIDKVIEMLDNMSKQGSEVLDDKICVDGNDLIKLGFKNGPSIGEMLNKLQLMREIGMPNNRELFLNISSEFLIGGKMKKYFGTDGIRGVANTELTNDFAYRVARAVGKHLDENKKVIIGMDTRLSSPMFMASMTAGFIAEGVDVDQVGVISTPGVAYLTKMHGYGMGIMISASHNPYKYNGIKLIGPDGFKLSDEEEIVIENIIDNLEKEDLDGDKIGNVRVACNLINDYIVHLEKLAGDGFKGVKIAIDAGNGVMSKIAPRVFEELGAEVVSVNCESNGRYINDMTGSTCPEVVAKLTKDNSCDIGISFDGDADRVIFSDENGEVLDGDHIISYAAVNLKTSKQLQGNGVVTTTMSNGAFEEYLKSQDINLLRADVGDKYVMQSMIENGYILGGEQSGHIIFLEHMTMGDGLQTAILIIKMLKDRGEKPSSIGRQYVDFPQVLVNANASEELKKSYRTNTNISREINKLVKENSDFRIIIRPSGTEKYVRIMIEGRSSEKILLEANNLKKVIEKEN